MFSKNVFLFLVLTSTLPVAHLSREICFKPVCKFTFVIRHALSMVYTTNNDNGLQVTYPLGMHSNGSLFLAPCSYTRQVPSDFAVPTEDVHTVDGHPRTIVTINDQFPGPSIEVVEGAEVVVNVVNELIKEGLTIHWHGMYMKNNPWMDGVAYITQCPISPKQSFQYRFIADPAGTHWYHSHYESQRADGLFGALIVHRKPPVVPYHVLIVNDWFPVTSQAFELDSPFFKPIGGPGHYFENPSNRAFMFDGTETSAMRYWSTLINGRGRSGDNMAPLSVFTVKPGTKTRIQIIMAGMEYHYRFSVDQHNLTVIETDGYPVKPVVVDSVLAFTGETYVLELTADQPVGTYWIRATVLRTGNSMDPKPDGKVFEGLAILKYEGAEGIREPRSQPTDCKRTRPCRVLNCPWVLYNKQWLPNRKCIPVSELKPDVEQESDLIKQRFRPTNPRFQNVDRSFHFLGEGVPNDEDVFEVFLNFGFPVGSSINLHKNILPRGPFFQDPSTWGLTLCPRDCKESGCRCSHVIDIPFNRTVQIVLSAYGVVNHENAALIAMHHPVHIHGQAFQVVKLGYPIVNQTTGRALQCNPDIVCENSFCSRMRWRKGHATGLNLVDPPVKDVVTIPAYGYIVLRFRSDNPGYWFLHCHQLLHYMEGMSVILNISQQGLPPAPSGFPTCNNYAMDNDQFHSMLVKNKECLHSQCDYQKVTSQDEQSSTDNCPHDHVTCYHLLWTGFLCTTAGVVITCLFIRLMLMMRRTKWIIPLRYHDYEKLKEK